MMILTIISCAFLVISLIIGTRRRFDQISIVSIVFWISWILSFLVTLPFQYYINTLIIIALALLAKSSHSMLFIPLILLRASQILNMPAKYVTLIVMSTLFIGLVLYFFVRDKDRKNLDYLIIAFGGMTIEVTNYLI